MATVAGDLFFLPRSINAIIKHNLNLNLAVCVEAFTRCGIKILVPCYSQIGTPAATVPPLMLPAALPLLTEALTGPARPHRATPRPANFVSSICVQYCNNVYAYC